MGMLVQASYYGDACGVIEQHAALPATARRLGEDLYCIDAGYIEPWLACVYLLGRGGEYALIETGTSHTLATILALMRHCGIAADQLRYVIPTHVHLDHAGGAGACMRAFPGAKLVVHPRGARHMVDPERLIASATDVYGQARFSELYGTIESVDPARILTPEDGDTLQLGDSRLEFRFTRGHADHHFCVWDASTRGWFTGDMFGICYPWFRLSDGNLLFPSTTPTQFEPTQYLASLQLLDSYQPQRMYLTHSGVLPYTTDSLHRLEEQLEQFCALARQFPDDTASLAAGLEQQLLNSGVQLGFQGGVAELRRLLLMDIELNAQGLAIWAQRQAKQGAPA